MDTFGNLLNRKWKLLLEPGTLVAPGHVADTKGNILSTVLQCNVDSFSRDVGATDIQGNIICDLARMWTYIAEQCYVALIQGNILCNIELYRLIQPSWGCLMREQLEPKKHERL